MKPAPRCAALKKAVKGTSDDADITVRLMYSLLIKADLWQLAVSDRLPFPIAFAAAATAAAAAAATMAEA